MARAEVAVLDGPDFRAADLRPEVRDFYEHTVTFFTAVRLINTTSAIPLRISKSAFENIIQTIEDSLASIATGKLFIQKSTPLKAKLTKENFRLSVGKIKPE